MSTDPLSPAAHTVERYIAFFNTLDTQQDLNAITTLTHVDIRFQDPFNDVIGHTALIKVLEHFRNTIKTALHGEGTRLAGVGLSGALGLFRAV